jgi:hypothetical protein
MDRFNVTPDGRWALESLLNPLRQRLQSVNVYQFAQNLPGDLARYLVGAIELHPQDPLNAVLNELRTEILHLAAIEAEDRVRVMGGNPAINSYDIYFIASDVPEYKEVLTPLQFPFEGPVPFQAERIDDGARAGLANYLSAYSRNISGESNVQERTDELMRTILGRLQPGATFLDLFQTLASIR